MEPPVAPSRRYTVQEYFDLEAESPYKREFRGGEVICMPGSTVMHSLVSADIARELGNRLKGTPCRVYSESLRVEMIKRFLYAHPDITVICGDPELDPNDHRGETAVKPRLVVGVLSPSTELFDRTKKFQRLMER